MEKILLEILKRMHISTGGLHPFSIKQGSNKITNPYFLKNSFESVQLLDQCPLSNYTLLYKMHSSISSQHELFLISDNISIKCCRQPSSKAFVHSSLSSVSLLITHKHLSKNKKCLKTVLS
ncbi:hypothetical protein BpHYR1_012167 [Brachionus plicatilis]|uniref:Uncharacterized protein n=1 Tax=Brachionus plicatilis TaxID=10195 RepID=A0A3M7SCP1_BRAPC|nr:hypothetical protein BpHYR1_012167 [Brachionus plicatilis]